MNGKLGTINIGNTAGGVNWPGSAFDPETGWFYTQASNSQVTVGSLAPPPAGFSDLPYQQGVVVSPSGWPWRQAPAPTPMRGAAVAARREGPRQVRLQPQSPRRQPRLSRVPAPLAPSPAAAPAAPRPRDAPAAGATGRPRRGGGEGGGGANVQGLSLVKPPYGVVAAIDLNKGEIMWQVPHGDTPDNVRNHPALKGLNIPKTGQNGSVGMLVTKTLVIAGDPQVTAPPGRPRGAMLHAYDKKTGAEQGAVWIPAPQSGSPMTYTVDGRQYIVVAVSGGNYSGEYIAFSLPDSEVKPTGQN